MVGNEERRWHDGGAARRAKTRFLHLKIFLSGKKYDSDNELEGER
jgi:hypothetical protein